MFPPSCAKTLQGRFEFGGGSNQRAKPNGFQPAKGGTNSAIGAKFSVNYTTSTLFLLEQPAHSRLFVPAQQNPSLGVSLAQNLNFLRVSGAGSKSKKVQEDKLPQSSRFYNSNLKLTEAPFGFAPLTQARVWL